MNKPKLIIMVGNIASGKSTWIRSFLGAKSTEERKNWVVLSKDDIRRMLGAGSYLWEEYIEPIIQTSLIDILQNFMTWDVNIICDETNMNKITRKAYLHLTKKFNREGYDYKTIAVVIPKIPREQAIEWRCGLKDSAWGFSASIWREVWERKNSEFEIPTKEEGFDEILEIGNSTLVSDI